MRKLHIVRTTTAVVTAAAASLARAAGDSGTSSVAEMQVTPLMFFGLLAAVVGLGLLLLAMAKFMGGPRLRWRASGPGLPPPEAA